MVCNMTYLGHQLFYYPLVTSPRPEPFVAEHPARRGLNKLLIIFVTI